MASSADRSTEILDRLFEVRRSCAHVPNLAAAVLGSNTITQKCALVLNFSDRGTMQG